MKRWIKRLCVLLLCAVLTVCALPKTQGATVYFMAVNDTFLGLSDTMPTLHNGVLYVPYTLFSPQVTGVNLGVTAAYSALKNRVMLYSSQNQLTFDMEQDATYDMNGVFYSGRAMMRNSMVYLPIGQLCAVFSDLEYTVNYTECGYLVRVKNDKAVLSDEGFIDAAQNSMKNALDRYEAGQPTQSDPVEPTPTPAVPTPDPGQGSGAAVYLGFTLEDTAGVDALLSALESRECRGIFFLTAGQMTRWDDLVRRLIGEGHFVGLLAEGGDVDSAMEAVEEGRRVLAAVARCRVSAVLAPALDDEGRAALEQAGIVCWQTTVDGRGQTGSAYARAWTLMDDMTGGQSARNYLLLDETWSGVLSGMTATLLNENYRLRAPVSPEL